MKLKICLMGLLCLFFKVNAQQLPPVSGLKVGDKVPDVQISRIINYSVPTTHIAAFNNQLVILDFWATWCASCISHFPKMYTLQKTFGDQIQVLLVSSSKTRDSEPAVKAFLNRRKQQYQFPCVVSDTLLDNLFPHHSLPHYALIKNSQVVAITDAESINEESIKALLNHRGFKMLVKNDNNFDRNKNLFMDGNGGTLPSDFYRSLLTGSVAGLNGYIGFQRNGSNLVNRIYAINQTLYSLYAMANPSFSSFEPSRVLYEIGDPGQLNLDSAASRDITKSRFTYESGFSARADNDALEVMRADLNRYFHLRIDSQYRDTMCYIFKRERGTHLPVSGKEKRETNLSEVDGAPKFLHNLPIDYLRRELQEIYRIPFIDETGYADNVSLNLPSNLLKVDELAGMLLKQGIRIVREKRKISYLVLSPQQADNGQRQD